MKQVYFTSVPAHPDFPAPDFTLRAASAGSDPVRLELVRAHAAAALPVGITEETPAAALPVRLALLHPPELGRILCHCSWSGPHRAPFAHVLVDVADAHDAQHAVQTWGSPLWQRADDEGGAELPEMLYLPVADVLTDKALQVFLGQSARREVVQFLIAAYLTAGPGRRVFIAAPAADVALCVYAVTRAVPLALLDDLTFSTFERDPLSCFARLVGTSWAEGAETDLPEACYGDQGLAINTYSGRRSELPVALPFAEFAVDALAGGKTASLDEFRNTWQRLGIKDASLFDLIYRMARGTGVLTKEESARALQNASLAAWIATRPDALQQFLEWALDDLTYATNAFSRAVVALRQKPEALQKLAQTVHERAIAAVRGGDHRKAANILEGVLPMVAPSRAQAVWGDLLNQVAEPASLTWEMHWYLLPRFARLKPPVPGLPLDPAVAKWLHVPPEQLGALLALELPRAYQLAACLNCLKKIGEPGPIARTLAAYPPLVLTLLHLPNELPGGEAGSLTLLDAVANEAPKYPWVEEMLRQAVGLTVEQIDHALATALQADRIQPATLIRSQSATLLTLLTGKPSLNRLTHDFLATPPPELLADADLLGFLKQLSEDPCLTPEVKTRLTACLTVQRYLQQPELSAEALNGGAAALALQPPLFPADTINRVVAKAAIEVERQANSPTVQADLEQVLLSLGQQIAGGPTALYRTLLGIEQQHKTFWREIELLHAFLALALGAATSRELAGQLDGLETDAYALALQIAKRGRKRRLATLSKRTADWPRPAQAQWSFLAKAIKPRGLRGTFRDVVFFTAGVAVATLAGAVAKLLGVL